MMTVLQIVNELINIQAVENDPMRESGEYRGNINTSHLNELMRKGLVESCSHADYVEVSLLGKLVILGYESKIANI